MKYVSRSLSPEWRRAAVETNDARGTEFAPVATTRFLSSHVLLAWIYVDARVEYRTDLSVCSHGYGKRKRKEERRVENEEESRSWTRGSKGKSEEGKSMCTAILSLISRVLIESR